MERMIGRIDVEHDDDVRTSNNPLFFSSIIYDILNVTSAKVIIIA
jgi:hypothetical protein